MMLSGGIAAGLWALVSASALFIGAALGWYGRLGHRAIAAITAFGSGVLISALSFDMMDEAWAHGGIVPTTVGLFVGAAAYTVINRIVARMGAARLAAGHAHPHDGRSQIVGAMLRGVPEALVIGVSLLETTGIGLVAVAAVFLSNIPEGLSGSAAMRAAGRSPAFVIGLWSAVAVSMALAAGLGALLLDKETLTTVALVQAFGAGAILAMLLDTAVPEAFEDLRDYTGLIAVAGFLLAFALSKAVH